MDVNIIGDIKIDLVSQYGFNFDNGEIEILGNNENLVFGTKDRVFRLTSSKHRSEGEIHEETNLLSILSKNSASVVKILESLKGEKYIKSNSLELFITAFEKAKGKIIDIDDFNDKELLFQEWGRTMGEIHRITSENEGSLDYSKRLDWSEEVIIKDAYILLPLEEKYIGDILNNIINGIKNLNKGNNNYGYVHTDMRPRNFHYNDGKIIHFDFDDISSNWFIYDIAVSIFHEVENLDTKEERTQKMLEILKNFIDGYLEEKNIDFQQFVKLIDFMHIRLIYAYIDYYKRLKIKGVDSGKEKMIRRKKFIGNMGEFIDLNIINNFIYSFKK